MRYSLAEQRRYLLSVALEARLSRFLKRCAHDWATGSHAGAGCTLPFLVDWCWNRAVELKENARELTAPLFTSAALPDRNVVRCLEHCVQQLTQLTGLLDAILTKCCNLVVPEALNEMEEKYKGIGTVSLYFQVVQWFLRCGLLPERNESCHALPYPGEHLTATYNKRRLKLNMLQDHSMGDDNAARKSCSLLYIDQLIEQEFGGDRIHQMWIRGGSENSGLYPPPSLYALLRLYLLPDIAEEHKHSLVLYLLVDYSMVYDEVRYEAVIRRLMQFPTMFGLSNTAIKATQAFWHLDHRDFDFALDQLQCLTGNTLSEWQHQVVLSSLLVQKKTQAALQYLHVRKPAPIQMSKNELNSSTVNDHDKLEDWQSSCDLYLARGLVFEALDVVRLCAQNAGSVDDKTLILNYFFKGCRNTGQLSKLLQVTLLPFEEEVFIRYLQNCNESQTSDILIMYYLQQARYLEAEQYNKQLKRTKLRNKQVSMSTDSLTDVLDREGAKDTLIEIMCSNLPDITNTVALKAFNTDWEIQRKTPKPMSVYVQARSPKNTLVYKSTFIQDTIENASETWMNRPMARKGLKRALNIEDTPFICTPKLAKTKNLYIDHMESSPPKRPRLDLTGTPKTPRSVRKPEPISQDMSILLDMPEVHTVKNYDCSRVTTPHSILKIRSCELSREMAVSPVDSRYLGESDDESLLETASNNTHYSDSTNKHLRFTIPTASESGSTPSPPVDDNAERAKETERLRSAQRERDVDMSLDSFITTDSHVMADPHPMESPPKKRATEETVPSKKSYKDSVRARRSHSVSANSSLSDDPNTSMESIADIPITLINPRYSGEKRRGSVKDNESAESASEDKVMEIDKETSRLEVPKTPKGRRGIRSSGESTPLMNRSRSRSRTPEISPHSSPLAPIPEQPKQENQSEPHLARTTLSAPRQLRSRSRTPERIEKIVESPRLEAIRESPTKSSDSPTSSPTRRNLRSRSRTPEVEASEISANQGNLSPRSLRSRSKTPEKLMSPKKDPPKSAKKSLARLVLEANATKQILEKQLESKQEKSDSVIECTPMKTLKPVSSLMDVTFSPIMGKSILQSPDESILAENLPEEAKSTDESLSVKTSPALTMNETKFGKSVLHSYESTITEVSREENTAKVEITTSKVEIKSIPAFTFNESCFGTSVLHSYDSSVAGGSTTHEEQGDKDDIQQKTPCSTSLVTSGFGESVLGSHNTTEEKSANRHVSSLMTSDSEIEEWKEKKQDQDMIQKEKEKIVEIEREINEIEKDISGEDDSDESDAMEIDTEGSNDDDDVDEDDDEEGEEDEEGDEEDFDESSESLSASTDEVISIGDSDDSDSNSGIPESKDIVPVQKKDSKNATEKIHLSEKGVAADEKVTADSKAQITKKDSKDNTDKIHVIESGTAMKAGRSYVITEQIFTASIPFETKVLKKVDSSDITDKVESVESSTDPLNQAQTSLLTDDNSDHSDMQLNYSDEKMETDSNAGVDIVDAAKEIENQPNPKDTETVRGITTKLVNEPMDTDQEKTASRDAVIGTEKITTEDKKTPSTEEAGQPQKSATRSKRARSTSSNSSIKNKEPAPDKSKSVQETSLSEPKSVSETEPKTPSRKRSQSTSNKSVIEEHKTPEDTKAEATTPSRRRAKTPSSVEGRKILTRRASKELSEKADDSQTLEDTSLSLTPRRRSTRSRSKNIDDNASVASGSSVRSTRSKVSEDAGDIKVARKGRKSVLPIKPDLSVIPEAVVEEKAEDIIAEYSSSRRLTRHQKSVLESWLEPKGSPSTRRRQMSVGSKASVSGASGHSHDDDDASSTNSAFDVQPIDRMSLLNKGDFEGSPDSSELQGNISPESVASDASKLRRARLTRASSEVKTTPKARTIRRVSLDVSSTDQPSTPGSATRGRRASFNKACEALHNTPKGRRTSTDVKKGDTDSTTSTPSPAGGEGEGPRRPRRTSATHTDTSTSKRTPTRKLSAIEESKDTKKK